MQKELAKELISFIDKSPTAFHATKTAVDILKSAGFKKLENSEKWNLKAGDKYYIEKNKSAFIAFIVGNEKIYNNGFKVIGAHTDSPCFKIKPKCEINVENSYVKLNTEGYGGAILSTWFDRPLSIAGRVVLKGKSSLKPKEKLININKPILIIPNMAIHMNRNVNDGYAINKQKDTLPLAGLINEKLEYKDYLVNLICTELEVDKKDILDFDLFLYEYENGCLLGAYEEFISSSRLDDLWMVFAGVKALSTSNSSDYTNVLICTDNEEIGSFTESGADSSFVSSVFERICLSLGCSKEEYYMALSNSIVMSADLAHALHPNNVEKHDLTNRPVLGRGPVLKIAASGSYSTNSVSGAIFKEICNDAKIPYQTFVNRSDMRGGTTIGPMISSHFSVPVIDMGTPILAMHSIRELASVKDNEYVNKLFSRFYNI